MDIINESEIRVEDSKGNVITKIPKAVMNEIKREVKTVMKLNGILRPKNIIVRMLDALGLDNYNGSLTATLSDGRKISIDVGVEEYYEDNYEMYLNYIAEDSLDTFAECVLNEDLGLDQNFKPLNIGGHKYVNSKTTFFLTYKGKQCPVTVYYRPEFGRFNKRELDKAIDLGACTIAQDVINKLPTAPDLVIWDNGGMRAVWNGGTKLTPYFITRN